MTQDLSKMVVSPTPKELEAVVEKVPEGAPLGTDLGFHPSSQSSNFSFV